MRKPFSRQRRLDCSAIDNVVLNVNCRHELIPILAGLRHLYSQPNLRNRILRRIAQDINHNSRRDVGREGLDDWQILVLAGVRLGCNFNYDELHDLAEQHRALREIMGIGQWDVKTSFNWRRIRNTLCSLKAETLDAINELVIGEGHRLCPEAAKKVRADSFVVETNIHYPTESSLIIDGMGKILPLCAAISSELDISGWRQHEHLLRRMRNIAITISRVSAAKRAGYQKRLQGLYRRLLQRANKILARAKELVNQVSDREASIATLGKIADLLGYIKLTSQVCSTAQRRVINGETVPNHEKLFSIFETHTQLYRRGKQAEPNQFGRLVMVYEDGAGFISHHYLVPRDVQDADVVVEQTRIAQKRHQGQIEDASFDRGFYSPENERRLKSIIEHACMPKRAPSQFAEQMKNASVRFHQARQRHPGIESAIGALQFGNGLERSRDRTEVGFERYIGLAILGRNLHVLGKLLIQQQAPEQATAHSRRKPAA